MGKIENMMEVIMIWINFHDKLKKAGVPVRLRVALWRKGWHTVEAVRDAMEVGTISPYRCGNASNAFNNYQILKKAVGADV